MRTNYFDHDPAELDRAVVNTVRAALGVTGAVALVVGIVILAWPVKTAMVIAGIIATYAGLAGIANLAVGIFSRRLGAWPRIGFLVLGAVFLAAAIFSLTNLGQAAAGIATFIGIVTGIAWIVEGFVGLTLIGDSPSKVWTIVSALLSIVGGVLVLASPIWGVSVMFFILGVWLVAIGLTQIVRAFRFGRA